MPRKSNQTTINQLPGLNSLRFFAALIVLIHHVYQLNYLFGLRSGPFPPAILLMGQLGMIFFFVLSGFLITYLLLEERENYGSISVRNFYIRRALRIWPIYYLVVLVGLFVLPHFHWFEIPRMSDGNGDGFGTKTAMYLLMAPNLVMCFFKPFPGVAQTWSIGVEEQFYLLWPHLFRRIKSNKTILRIFFGIIALFLILPALPPAAIERWPGSTKWFRLLGRFLSDEQFGCLSMGAVFAWLLKETSPKFLRSICNFFAFIAATFLAIFLVWQDYRFPYASNEAYSILFGVIILNVAANPDISFPFRLRSLDFLGKLSYGIYMYHIAIVAFTIHFALDLKSQGLLREEFFNVFVFIFALSVTIFVSWLSYRLIEVPFLRLKSSFAPDEIRKLKSKSSAFKKSKRASKAVSAPAK